MASVRVFFATNRNHIPAKQTFGGAFNPDGVAALRFGYADFAPDPKRPVRQALVVYPDKKGVQDVAKMGSGMFMTDLRAVMASGPKTDTLVFIHGFNVTFDGALQAGALLAQSLSVEGRPVNIVVFSWPSDGKAIPLMSYYSDREDARVTGPAVARAFLKFRDYVLALKDSEYCQRNVHLLVHSMGAYVLRNAIQALIAKDQNSLTRLFDQILLAAPDEDDDTFEHDTKLRLLPRIGRQVTVYFNPRDKGLLVSDKTKANPDRLGSDGPRMVDLIPKKIACVDCRIVSGAADPFVEHSYYIRSQAMAADISNVLADHPLDGFPNREYLPRTRNWRIATEPGPTTVEVPDAAVARPQS
ncbi:alpha/beta hydrolase [Brevundimonas goettingensis]|uniref:Alpha/beta fold hydrolase n=1 Tax=Brevundimonas goettingensis TaxID=2774190 RepID=A0A975GWJ6_9CAUL|nr:alpha/beta fold hydrolase [Brevundimonas goettingensis]QTC92682.1 alpha/beta fold hydrolase [Brevundimonas goettingensis]